MTDNINPLDETEPTDSLVIDRVELRLELSDGEHEAKRIVAALRQMCTPPRPEPIVLHGVTHDIFFASSPGRKGSSHVEFSDGGCKTHLVLARVEQSSQQVHFDVELSLSNSDTYTRAWLNVGFDPTAILAGNNVLPAALALGESDVCEPNPSSHPRSVGAMLRLGPLVLEDVHRQVSRLGNGFYSPATRSSIARGDSGVIRVQFAGYQCTPDLRRFLQLTTIMYSQTIAADDGIIQLADYLGLRFQHYCDEQSHVVTGVLARQLSGNDPVISVSLYDKSRRVEDMSQTQALTADESAIVRDCVRIDVTLQPEGVRRLVSKAVTKLEIDPEFGANWSWRDKFVQDDPSSTIWSLERAIFVLSHREREGRMIRRSFGSYLLPHAIKDVLRMHVIAGFDAAKLHRLTRLDDPVAKAWVEAEAMGVDGWARRLTRRSGKADATVYSRRKKWLSEYGIDVMIPYPFYRDMLIYGPNSVMESAARSDLLRAVKEKDGDQAVSLLSQAAVDFNRQRVEIVGETIRNRPLEMTVRTTVTSRKPARLPQSRLFRQRPQRRSAENASE